MHCHKRLNLAGYFNGKLWFSQNLMDAVLFGTLAVHSDIILIEGDESVVKM